jgi:hypothetical protein
MTLLVSCADRAAGARAQAERAFATALPLGATLRSATRSGPRATSVSEADPILSPIFAPAIARGAQEHSGSDLVE